MNLSKYIHFFHFWNFPKTEKVEIDSGKIKFSLESPQRVRLRVLDSLGQVVKKIIDEEKLLKKFSRWLEVAEARCPGDIQYMLEQLLEGLAKHTHTPHTLQMLDASNKTQLSRLTLTLYEHGIKSLRRQQNPNSSTQIVPEGHKLRLLWQNLISTKNEAK